MPQQEALYTTSESRNSSWSLLCALDASGSATGQIYVDDGESLIPDATLLMDLTASSGSLYASSRGMYLNTNALANVTVMSVGAEPSTVLLNGQEVSNGVAYNSSSQVLSRKGLESLTSDGA